ncbi:hypothetical protein [Desulfosporosinus sp. OT]|uniref:hypothetical protein n=1 Tax=Desulfosporosinus sp. OT TaxID=913865 RepID=UPI001300C137|nr:hypothetical protein [Desulfosporosinus sp. OT]
MGCKTKDINISEGEKQFKNYPCAKFKGFSVYKICDLKFAVTEIDNRRVLSEEQVKEAVIAPVLKEYIGIILGFILFAGAFSLILYCLIFKNLPIYFFAIGLVLLMLSIFLCKWYEPEGVPSLWKQAKKKTAIVICIIIQNTIIHMVVEYIPHPIVKTRFFELKLFPFRFILIDFGYGTVFGVELCR